MTAAETKCPSCGAPVVFKTATSSIVVCEYCDTVVARGDLVLENLGKVAALADTGSPLAVGLRGSLEGVPFELTGRAQLQHAMGGVWDEWYAAFADGRWGWLAEAQGKLYLTFERKITGEVPGYEDLRVGQEIPGFTGGVTLVVAEKGTARAAGARGEIPYRLVPGETARYADLAGPGGKFATLDYSEATPRIYVGNEVTLADLGLAGRPAAGKEAKRVEAVKLSCRQCGGPLQLRAPDRTESVGCPQCGSLLEVKGNELELLKALEAPRVQPAIPLGSKGALRGVEWTVIGFVRRSVTIDGDRYYWTEHLLHEPANGFRWLVCSDGNWSFVEPVSTGEVRSTRSSATFRGKSYKAYARITATVEDVLGELYWRVQQGERAKAEDFVSAPYMLSKESSYVKGQAESSEVVWSLGTWVEPEVLESAFKVSRLPRPTRLGPLTPFRHGYVYRYWAILVAALCLASCLVTFRTSPRKVLARSFELAPVQSVTEGSRVFFTEPFELRSRQNVQVVARVTSGNGWFFVNGELIEQKTSSIAHRFAIPQDWSSRSPDVLLPAVDAGSYTLKLDMHWEHPKVGQAASVEVTQDVADANHASCCCSFFVLSVLPLVIGLWHLVFLGQRWQDSYFEDRARTTYGSDDDDGGEDD